MPKYLLICIWVVVCGCLDATMAGEQCVWGKVDKVVDGDTLRLQDGRWVRIAAIDTPEIDHKNQRADPLGYEARDFLRRRVKDRRICLKTGNRQNDGYGRMVAYLFDQHGVMLNDAIVAHGLGHVYPHHDENNVHAKKLLASQRQAMRQGLGIWRDRLKTKGAFIGNRRSKRFHLLDCPSGRKMAQKNRRAFASIWDAYWAGYAPAAGCLGSAIKKELQHR